MHLKVLPNFNKAHVLVVGDVMLDSYWHGSADRMSPEAPVPVIKMLQKNTRPGGAANVAINIASIGSEVILLGIVGEDSSAEDLTAHLDRPRVRCYFDAVPHGKTITKLRIVEKNQQMLRIDFDASFLEHDHTHLQDLYTKYMTDVDLVLLSDYGKGTLKNSPQLIALARARGIPIFVDPKGNDFSIYAGATLITPNLHEFETIVGRCGNDEALITQRAKALACKHQWEAILVTRGKDGMSLVYADERPSYHLHAHTREVFDVTGAGDTVIAFMAAATGAGLLLEEAAYLANVAAGLVVKKRGTATVSMAELRSELRHEWGMSRGTVEEAELILMVADAKAHGEKIIMTNGCFDILHAGHVQYLEQAKALGDRLIVAVNTDDSVRRLKGPSRPLNSLSARMDVLSALRAVDWVVAFDEDTPERLITAIGPDVLVKGGDYSIESIAGAEAVQQAGGQVCTVPLVPGYSTTNLIKKILTE